MQTRSSEAIGAIEDARSKIHTMALIHSQLYDSGNFDRVDMGLHIREMTDLLKHIYSEGKMVNFSVRASGIYLPIGQALWHLPSHRAGRALLPRPERTHCQRL